MRLTANSGFTLLEVLVVLLILSLVAAVGTPQVMKYLGKAKSDSARLQVESIASALDLYKLEVGRYPPQDPGLMALLVRPPQQARWNGPYLRKPEQLIDPWGVPFTYRAPGTDGRNFDLFTLGADQAVGGTGENVDVHYQ